MNIQRVIAFALAIGLAAMAAPAVSFASQDASAEACDPSEGGDLGQSVVDVPEEAEPVVRYASGAAECADSCEVHYEEVSTPGPLADAHAPSHAECTMESSSTQQACEIPYDEIVSHEPSPSQALRDYVQCHRDKCEIYGDEWTPPLPDKKPFNRLAPAIPVPSCMHLQ